MPGSLPCVDIDGQLPVDHADADEGYRRPTTDDDEQKTEVERYLRAEDEKIGSRLRDARRLAGMTLEQAAEKIGVSKAQAGHIEKGRNPARAAVLGVLSQLYRQSCDWLIPGVRRNGASPDGARLLSIFEELPERERSVVMEFAEDRMRRTAIPRLEKAARHRPRAARVFYLKDYRRPPP